MEEEDDIIRIIKDLKTLGKQEQAAGSLYYYLIKHRIEPETLIDKLRELLFSSSKLEQNGGLMAVNKILEVGRETKVLHFVSQVMPQIFRYSYQYDLDTMKRAVDCIGNLAQSGGSSNAENVESHVETCYEWIQHKHSKISIFGASDSKSNNKRLAAILVLTALCLKTPTVAYNKMISVNTNNRYLKLFDALNDPRLEVRIATVQFFRSVNKLIIQRDPNERKGFYDSIYERTRIVLLNPDKNGNFLHGALLMLTFLLTESEDLMKDKHEEIFDVVIKLSKKKNVLIQPQWIALFPTMARCNPTLFREYLDGVIKYLLEIAHSKTSPMKGDALRSLGKLSVIVDKAHFTEEYVYNVTLAIGIEIAAAKSSYFNDALDSLSNLCKQQGEAFDRNTDVIDLINVLFRDGLSKELIVTLNEISNICTQIYK